MNLKDKTILITGSTKGIGLAAAKKAAEKQANVIITGRNSRQYYLENTLEEDFLDKQNVIFIQCDFTMPEEVKKLKKQINRHFGKIDILINNAGITIVKDFAEMTIEDFDSINNINYRSVFVTTKEFLPDITKNEGAILNVLSVAVDSVFPKNSLYAAGKSAVSSMMKVLREEVREKKVDVVNLYPGAVSTELWPAEMREEFGYRMMQPEDIANTAINLISDCINDRLTVEEVVLRPKLGDI